MAVTYIGKKKMYSIANEHVVGFESIMKDCDYRKGYGGEWLDGYSQEYRVHVSSMYGGKWVRVIEEDFDGNVVRDEVVRKLFGCLMA